MDLLPRKNCNRQKFAESLEKRFSFIYHFFIKTRVFISFKINSSVIFNPRRLSTCAKFDSDQLKEWSPKWDTPYAYPRDIHILVHIIVISWGYVLFIFSVLGARKKFGDHWAKGPKNILRKIYIQTNFHFLYRRFILCFGFLFSTGLFFRWAWARSKIYLWLEILYYLRFSLISLSLLVL